MTSSIKTTVVGSYPIPDWLAAHPSEQGLIDATMAVFHTQELAGIDLIADGELYRFDINHPETNGMIEYFVRPLGGVRPVITRDDERRFYQQAGMSWRQRPSAVVEGPITEGALNLPRDFERARALTRAPLKFTVTGPHMLAKTLLDTYYGSLPERCAALAGVLAAQVAAISADTVQIDEANLPGHPEEWVWALECVNHVLDAVQRTPAVHLCFGNYGGQTIQRGTWDKLIEYLSGLHADHVVLEMAHRGPAELDYLAQVDKRIGMGIGVIDIKTNVIESPEEIARRIETAVRALGEGRLKYVHPDCGFWMLKRSVADAKIRNLVKGRDLFEGRA